MSDYRVIEGGQGESPLDPGYKINNLNDQFIESAYQSSTSTKRSCQFGLECLDDGLVHLFSDDLVLIGAPTGTGKTQLCAHFAQVNAQAGKKVYYVALEAAEQEIKDRILYGIYTKLYFADRYRQQLDYPVNYLNWSVGRLNEAFTRYQVEVEAELQTWPENIEIVSRTSKFDITALKDLLNVAKLDDPELFIIDHAHYFDYDTTNDNKALKDIMMACRDITQLHNIPVILVAHLRKKSQGADEEIVPGINEFHGSSDLTKIATRVITLQQGAMRDNSVKTFFRVAKDRRGSQLTRYITACDYNVDLQRYARPEYVIGKIIYERGKGNVFQPCSDNERPKWATNARPMKVQE